MADPITATLPDGTTVTFEADITPKEIERRMVLLKQADPKRFQPPPAEEESLGEFAKGFGRNVLKSGAGVIGGAASALRHPITTAENLGNVGLGVAEKAFGLAPQHEQYAEAAGEYFKNRYGGWENIKKTAYEDPVGALLDVAPLAGAAGTGLRVAGTAGKLGAVADIGRGLETASTLGIPKAIGAVAEPLKERGIGLMVRALKPTNAVLEGVGKRWGPISDLTGRARGIAEKLIEEGVNPNEEGVQTLMQRLAANEQEMKNLAQGSTALVDTAPSELNIKAGRAASTKQIAGEPQTAAWDQVLEEWQRNPHASAPVTQQVPTYNPITGTFTPQPKVTGHALKPQIPYPLAQELKQGTYRAIGDAKYGELSTPRVEAMKAGARGLREAQDIAEPAGATLNARTGELIDLRDVLSGSSKRIQNLSAVDLLTIIGASGGHPGTAAIALANRPAIAARLARLLHATGRGAGRLAGISDPSLRAALLARLGEPDEDQQQPPSP
jgi:hypothetical protein